MSTPPWMLVRLALETNHHHADADSDRLALMEIANEREYRDGLARIFGFEAAVEAAVDQLGVAERAFFVARGKQDLLKRDLLALGMAEVEIDLIPQCTTVKIRSVEQAYGWAFVLERQTLLAGLLRRHLEHAYPDCIARAGSYLSAYADVVGSRFRALGEAIGAHARGSGTPAAIVTAANEGFRAQRQWYAASLLHERLRVRLDDPQRARRGIQVIEVAPTPAPPIVVETVACEPEPITPSRVESSDLVS